MSWFKRYEIGALLVFGILVFLTSFIGSQFTFSSLGSWYASINKPSWNPPSWVFGPVWTLLYIFIAISGWLVWRARHRTAVGVHLTLYGIQLVLNALWSVIFFGMQNPSLASTEIAVLWLIIGAYTLLVWRIQRTAALLFLPYWAWVTFAAALTFTIASLNP
jgi:benzodiazapine receptor